MRYVVCTIALSDPDGVRDSQYTTDPGASPTLRFCDHGQQKHPYATSSTLANPLGRGLLYNVDGDTSYYTPAIQEWSVEHENTGFGTDLRDASGVIVLDNHRYVWQQIHAAGGVETDIHAVKLSSSLADWLWVGRTVTVKIVTEQFDYSSSGGDHKGQTIFTGIMQEPIVEPDRITLRIVPPVRYEAHQVPDQDVYWFGGTAIGESIITRLNNPNAPDQYVGKVVPMTYTGADAGIAQLRTSPRLLGCLWPVPVYDAKTASSVNIKIGVNRYTTSATPATPEVYMYLSDTDNLARYAGSINVTNSETYCQVDSSSYSWYVHVYPTEIVSESGITNAGNCFDGRLDTYAVFSNSATLKLRLPYVGPYGRIVGAWAYINVLTGTGVDTGSGGSSVNGTFGIYNNTATSYFGSTSTNITKADIEADTNMDGTSMASAQYEETDFSSWKWETRSGTTRQDLVLQVLTNQSGVTMNLQACGMVVLFKPSNFAGGSYPANGAAIGRTRKRGDGRIVPGGGTR